MDVITDELKNVQKDPSNRDISSKNKSPEQLNDEIVSNKAVSQEEPNRNRCYNGVQKYR